MSLNITLRIEVDCGGTHGMESFEVFETNITHNLGGMAHEASIYRSLWRPEELGVKLAGEIIDTLEIGLMRLKDRPDHFKKFNSPNGWGIYDNFVPFVEEYLIACRRYPKAIIEVCR